MDVKEDVNLYLVRAMTYLRTTLICWEAKLKSDEMNEIEKTLKEHGHCKGRVVEVAGIKF